MVEELRKHMKDEDKHLFGNDIDYEKNDSNSDVEKQLPQKSNKRAKKKKAAKVNNTATIGDDDDIIKLI